MVAETTALGAAYLAGLKAGLLRPAAKPLGRLSPPLGRAMPLIRAQEMDPDQPRSGLQRAGAMPSRRVRSGATT